MLYKRFELDVSSIDIENYYLKTSKAFILEIEKDIYLEATFHCSEEYFYSVEYRVVNTGDYVKITTNKERDIIKDRYLIYNLSIKIADKDYKILMKIKYKEDDYDLKEYLKWLSVRASNCWGDAVEFKSITKKGKEIIDNLFCYEDANNKGVITLIYYYIYLLYHSKREQVILDKAYLLDIINNKAEFLGICYDKYNKKTFKELFNGFNVESEDATEKLLAIINDKNNLTESNLYDLMENAGWYDF